MLESIWTKLNKVITKTIDKIKHREPWYKYYTNTKKIEYPNASIYELIEKTAESYPFYDAYEYFGKRVTYREFMIQIKRTASALVELGVKEGDRVTITAYSVPEGQKFTGWTRSGGGSISGSGSMNATVIIGTTDTTVTANYRDLEYYTLTVTTHSGTTSEVKEKDDYFSINAAPYPDGYTFDKWTGDTSGLRTANASTGTYMGSGDRTITANYRLINPHVLTVKQLSGDVTYEQAE